MLITIFTFIIVLGILVFVHELGHFIAARRSGMKVDEFGFGFPPRLAGVQKVNGKFRWVWGHKTPTDSDETVYSINWIPLGGFVKIRGENNEHEEDPRSFINRPFWARFVTLIAGVTMNVLFAWIILSIGFMVGLPSVIDSPSQIPKGASLKNPQVVIADVTAGQPADKAGLKPGDIVLSVDGKDFSKNSTSEDIQKYVFENKGKEFNFTVKRLNQTVTANVQSLENPGPDQGPTGIGLANVGQLRYPWYKALGVGIVDVWYRLTSIATGLWSLVTGHVSLSSLGGPVKIAQLTGQVADMGFAYLIQFTAFLSLNLALLNILPFPALDGGRILFLIIEKIRGKRNNQAVEQWVNTIGFVALLLLMVIVTAHDLSGIGGIGRFLNRIF